MKNKFLNYSHHKFAKPTNYFLSCLKKIRGKTLMLLYNYSKHYVGYPFHSLVQPVKNNTLKKACYAEDLQLAKSILSRGADPTTVVDHNRYKYSVIFLNKTFKYEHECVLDLVFDNIEKNIPFNNGWKDLFCDMISHAKQIDQDILDRLIYHACFIFFHEATFNNNCMNRTLAIINTLIEKKATIDKEFLDDILNYTHHLNPLVRYNISLSLRQEGIFVNDENLPTVLDHIFDFDNKKNKLLLSILDTYTRTTSLRESRELVRSLNITHEEKTQALNILELNRNNQIIDLCIKSKKARSNTFQLKM